MDGKRRHPRQGRRADKTTTSFSNEKLEVQKLARMPIFEPSLVSAASTDGRGIEAHDVCIKTGQDARF